MGKIIERVREREAKKAKRIKERDPLAEYYLQQQRAMQNTNPLSPLHSAYARGLGNAYQVQWLDDRNVSPISEPPKPWWRFW